MPRVSVVIPTFNRAHCLMRAVRSVVAQDFEDWDITVVDDASTDGTVDVRGKLNEIIGSRYKDVVLPPSGASRARNVGIAQTDSEWVAFLDSDDLWLPEKIGLQLQAAEAADAAFVYSDYFEFTDRNGVTCPAHLIPADMSGNIYPQLLQVRCNVITCPSVMIRRSVLEDVGGFDDTLKICEDIDLWRRAARGRRVDIVDKPLTGVNIREDAVFPYQSSLLGRMMLYQKALADDIDLETQIPGWYLELLHTYRQVASNRGDVQVRAVLDAARAAITKPNASAAASHSAVQRAVDSIGALMPRPVALAG